MPLHESKVMTNTQKRSEGGHFSNLPMDIVFQILQHLDPLDIVAMRATSRSLHVATSERIVWLSVLDRICEHYGIFKPTFPFEEMSLAQLEHAAFSSSRFVKTVQRFDPGPLGDNCAPVYQHRTIKSPRNADGKGRLFLIPGGRFLLTSGTEIRLWDLGHSSEPYHVKPRVIARTEDGSALAAVCPSDDGKGLVVAATSSADGRSTLRIYEIDIQCNSPAFSKAAELVFDDIPHFSSLMNFHLTSSNIVIHCRTYFASWNWKERTGCKWPIGKEEISDLSIYGIDDTVIVFDNDNQFNIWDVPDHCPLSHPSSNDLANKPRRPKRFHRPAKTPALATHWNTIFSGTPVWQRHLPPYLCTMATNSLHQHVKGASFMPMYTPVLQRKAEAVFSDYYERVSELVSPLYQSGDHLVFCASSSQSEATLVAAMPIPKEYSKEPIPISYMMLSDGLGGTFNHFITVHNGFCPMSGRLAYAREGVDEIVILDYLPLFSAERR
ncbi:hypothetical protein DFP72DRAFT_871968 [Ephemerocybe angulata]|uniref:F-box domain-containing protein n=1 Tax=Ephemerocybe angulata TaxID=980116 RepID=A0A8H6IGC3_9AGAR|nr:hypothetical protein DFP72DRAFT_871968 [Tulosesus angulatus]